VNRVQPGGGRAPGLVAAANVCGATVLVLVCALIPLTAAGKDGFSGVLGSLAFVLAFGAVGLVVARAQPRNPMGWLMLALALLLALSSVGGAYADLVYRAGHRTWPLGWVAVLLDLLWSVMIVGAGAMILLYPDGRLAGPWRWVLRVYLLIGACWPAAIYAVALAAIAGHRIQVGSGGDLTIVTSPAGSSAWLAPVQELALPVLIAFWLLFLGRQAVSYRSSSGERRAQLKWLVLGAAITLAGGAVVTLVGTLDTSESTFVQAVIQLASVVTIAFPLGMGVGILRYRLYEIDRLISRTLAYAVVTGLLVGIYAGLVLLSTQVFKLHGSVAVAASTLVVAALFNPARRRVQRQVDRRFNRARYDTDLVIGAFAARLQDAVELEAVLADLTGIVHGALEPAHVSVWVSRPGHAP
jgi:hypothetical protein